MLIKDPRLESSQKIPNSFFHDSSSSICSKKEVVTLVALGILMLIAASTALYGYLFNPLWITGSHVLAAITLLTLIVIGGLALLKFTKNPDCVKNLT